MNPNVDTIHYLSPLQHGMLHHSRLDPRSGVYVEQFSCLLRGALDWDRFCQAWQAVAQRHDVLKTLFMRLQEAQPLQVVLKSVQLPITQLDWSDLDPLQQQVRFEDLLHSDRVQGFDASRPPLMRLHLIRLGAQQTRFLWTYHHAILDGWSMPIVLSEVFEHYAGRAAGQPRPPRDYRHYLAWLRQQDVPAAMDFWKAQLAGYRQPLRWAPSVRPADADLQAPRRLGHWQGTMPAAWVQEAQQLCRGSRLTLNTLCQAAWALLLALHGGQDDLCYGMVVSGRNPALAGVERMVGLFINTLPMRVKLDPQAAVQDWLQGLQQQSQEVEARAYSALSEVLACSELPRQQALFDALYVFENYPGQAAFRDLVAAQGLAVDDVRAVEETSYGLALIVLPGESLQFTLSHDRALFSPEAIASLGQQFQALLGRLVAQPQAALGSIGLLPAPASADLPDTPADTRSLLALLAAGVSQQPQDLALLAQGLRCTHAELLETCQQGLAAWQAQGLQPGDRVLLWPDEQAPVQSLAMLLSGLAAGLDCLWPADESSSWPERLAQDLTPRLGVFAGNAGPDAAAAETRAWSALLADGRAAGARPAEVKLQAGDDHAVGTAAGAISLLDSPAEPGPEGRHRSRLLRYTQAQLVQALAGPATGEAPPQLAATGWLHGSALWSALRTLLQGGTLHTLSSAELDALLQGQAAQPPAFDTLLLSPREARRLDLRPSLPASAAPLALRRWTLDAAALSPAGQQRLQRLAPQAQLQRDWHQPAHSLPHAHALGTAEHLILQAAPGTLLQLRDPHQQPAATYAWGRLQLAGASVPSLFRQDGQGPSTLGWLAGQQPRLLSGLPAWQGRQGLGVEALSLLASPAREALAATAALERALARIDGIQELALLDIVDPAGQWASWLFFVPAPGRLAAALEAALREAAAAQGQPQLRALPSLPRREGAVDRDALLRLAQTPAEAQGHVAPRDELEQQLHDIWAALLKTPQISVHANYFDLGGQSLLASVLLFQVEEKLGTRLGMEQLMAGPTIAELAHCLRSGDTAQEPATLNLPAEAVLDPAIRPAAPAPGGPAREVLLTGATGFLGAHLLAELLASTDARVHCLVRAPDADSGHRRLVEALQAHGLWDQRHAARMVALPGDLGAPNLGLTPALHSQMAQTLDAIYHNGALVNFVYPYAMLKPANVDATADILRLACEHHAKPVHYISTVGVLNRRAEVIGEDLDVPFHALLQGGYEQSKWVAEQLVAEAGRRGLPVCIYRPSRIVGHSVTGRMNTDDLFSRLIKGIAVFGKAPKDVGFDNILPVDLAARLIVEASRHPEAPGHAVHVLNPDWNSLDEVVDLIEARGFALERLPYEDWLARLSEHVRQDSSHPLAMLIPVLQKLNPVADPSVGARLPIALDHLKAWAPRALSEGLQPAAQWLDRYFGHFQRSGFLPTHGALAPAIQSITQQGG